MEQFQSKVATQWVTNGDIRLEVKTLGDGPVIVCVHGWPELWYSYRHQMEYFAAKGFKVAAINVRGYGENSAPSEIEAYTLEALSDDVAAVIATLSEEPVILFGHDWGAPIAYHTALRFEDRVRAIAGLSVPYRAPNGMSGLDLWRALYPDQFFYQLYIEQPGVFESAFEKDQVSALRKIYYALSGEAPLDHWIRHQPADAGMLDSLVDPDPFPDWMQESDWAVYIEAFKISGMMGPANRYRAQAFDALALPELHGKRLAQPSCFIGGSRDAVRHFIPGEDLYEAPGADCLDYRGTTLIDGAGHWVQQEAPEQTNAALDQFVQGL